MVIGRHHPSLYGALLEIQREQADTETMVTQLELGQKVKAAPKKTWLVATFAENINEAGDSDEDKEEQILNYLRKLGYMFSL